MDNTPALVCGCGHEFEAALGAYGCPNCEGDKGPATDKLFYLVVAGGRDFDDYGRACQVLDVFIDTVLAHTPVVIVSGGARGADRLAERYAHDRRLPLMVVPADWDRHGKRAGTLRNEEMGNMADGLVAFWDGESRGTRHMIAYMRKLGKPTKTVNY